MALVASSAAIPGTPGAASRAVAAPTDRARNLVAIGLPGPQKLGARSVDSATASATAGWSEDGTVRVRTPSVSLSTDSTLSIDVDTRLDQTTEYLEIRLRVRRPSGSLFFQKTEIVHAAPAGVQTVSFVRSLASFELREGRYPVEVRVLASGRDQVDVEDRLLLIGETGTTVSLVPIVRIRCSPSMDPQGRFVNDPAIYTRERDEIEALIAFTKRLPTQERLTLAVPPFLLEEWLGIVDGYELVGPDGVTEVGKDSPSARAYAGALSDLRTAVASNRLELLTVPFAEPDLAGLQRMDALEDLDAHLSRGQSVYAAALDATPTPTVVSMGNVMPAAAVDILARHGISSVLIAPSSARVGATRPAPGLYRVASDMKAVVVDADASSLLTSGAAGSHGLADTLFDLRSAAEGTRSAAPLVTLVDVGSGSKLRVETLAVQLDRLTATGWIRIAPASTVTRLSTRRTARLDTTVRTGNPAPGDYWAQVENARAKTLGLSAALGPKDPQSSAAMHDLLLAESRLWAGPDQQWSLADRGRAHASAAERTADSVFSKVVMSVKDMTLSSTQGKLPIAIQNGSGKGLRLNLRVSAQRLRITGGPKRELTLGPDDNLVTLPVRLGSSLSDRALVSLWADGYEVAAVTVMVRASYLDRFAVILIVTLILGGLLWYIRRHTRAAELEADADGANIDDDDRDRSESR